MSAPKNFVAVIDGQGGGIGRALVERLRALLGPDFPIIALGTNPLATSAMLKAGASKGASGENAIAVNAPKAAVIVGSIGIIAPNAMLGEVTPEMACAVSSSDAKKILIPMNKCGMAVVGTVEKPLPYYIDEAAEKVKLLIDKESTCK